MIEQDTVRLLRECDAGVKMGISSLDDVMDAVRAEDMKTMLQRCKAEHEKLDYDIREALNRFQDEGKEPNAMAKVMSEMKTSMKLAMHESDQTIADLMTDGCNMGVKSLTKYLNQYKAADEASKDIAKRLIHVEDQLAIGLRPYL